MVVGGFHGKILQVNLSRKSFSEVEVKDGEVKSFVGGTGLATSILYDYLTLDLNPLSPEAPLLFITGPFTGTIVPLSSRYALAGKSPLTSLWGESTSGGYFPVFLKQTGYDGILITGSSERPCYLLVGEDGVEFRDASHLWGISTYETMNVIKKETGRKVYVACIGPAGENLVKYACVLNDSGRAAGRCGLGAVMGSKKLKAVAVYGNKRPEVAKIDNLREVVDLALNEVRLNPFIHIIKEYSPAGYVSVGYGFGDTPAYYFSSTVFPMVKVSGRTLKLNYYVKDEPCIGCPIRCGKKILYGKNGIDYVDTVGYEALISLGPLCGIFNLDDIIKNYHLCNVYGLDIISTGVVLAFSIYLYKEGFLTSNELNGGIDYGDSGKIISLVEKIAKRIGVGSLLAEGVKNVGLKLGVSQEELCHVKGLEVPMHEPRAFSMQALSYVTGSRGGCHLRPDYFLIDVTTTSLPELEIFPSDRFDESERKIGMMIRFQNVREVFDSLILCKFSPFSLTTITNLYNAVTGLQLTPLELNMTGERIYNLKRCINIKLGMRRGDEKLPSRLTKPLKDGATLEYSPNIDEMLKKYYKIREIDWNTGKPSKNKLLSLSLEKQAKELWK
ncbi:MAG: aldehyde ferredoxin oxidoreductase family protein [Candidatus Bathyarchaeota archaeon]